MTTLVYALTNYFELCSALTHPFRVADPIKGPQAAARRLDQEQSAHPDEKSTEKGLIFASI